MPQIDSGVVSLLAGVFSALAQLVKGVLFTEEQKRWLPIGIVVFAALADTLLVFYYGGDPVTGLVTGVIAGLSSVGLYSTAKSVVPSVVNEDGWVRKKD